MSAFLRASADYGRGLSCALIAALIVVASVPREAWACACGCGVFEVGTSAMLPTGTGGLAFLEYDYLDQDRNWSGTSRAPAANNSDKELRTHFFTAGIDYMFNHRWGVELELPVWDRTFKTTDEDSGRLASFHHAALGDIRVIGDYTGLSGDMSTGLQLGIKLPSGDYTYPHFDRDTSIGTGSTDLLFGAYHMGALTKSGNFDWFTRSLLEVPVATADHYRPGVEVNLALGAYYSGWSLGNNLHIAPILQLIGTHRARDAGANADPIDTGYDRLIVSPGIEGNFHDFKVDVAIGVPIYQRMNGNQIVAPAFFQFIVAHAF